jgi:hypothetical protein
MHDKALRLFCALTSSLACAAFVACAGSNTPSVDDDFEEALDQTFADGAVATAGRGGSSATGGAGRGGASAGRGGSSTAAGGTGGVQERPPPAGNGVCDGFAVLQTNCSGPSCHSSGSLDNFAESEADARAVIGVPGTATCTEGDLLNPDNPRQSIILQKVNGAASCGVPMPPNLPALSDDDISCLEDWIAAL